MTNRQVAMLCACILVAGRGVTKDIWEFANRIMAWLEPENRHY